MLACCLGMLLILVVFGCAESLVSLCVFASVVVAAAVVAVVVVAVVIGCFLFHLSFIRVLSFFVVVGSFLSCRCQLLFVSFVPPCPVCFS